MSLINDALKRAKQAQLNAPAAPAPGPRLRPVEPAPDLGRRLGLMLPVMTLVAITLAALFGWRLFLKSNPSQSPAHTSPPPALSLAGKPVPSRDAKATPAPLAPSASLPETGSPPRTRAEPPTEHTTPAATSSVAGPASSLPNVSPMPVPVVAGSPPTLETTSAPKPAPLKLQGILFDPAHPSAMISGHTLFIGDKLGEWRVTAISQESATLVSSGQTNLLTLPQ